MHVTASWLQHSQQPGITFYFALGELHPETSLPCLPHHMHVLEVQSSGSALTSQAALTRPDHP